MSADWADVEDHDALNDLVGQRIDAIETGIEVGRSWLAVRTNRGQVLRLVSCDDEFGELSFTID